MGTDERVDSMHVRAETPKLKPEVKTVNVYRDSSSGCRHARTLSVGTCGKVAKMFGR